MKDCVRCPEYRPGKPINKIPTGWKTRVCGPCGKTIDKKLDEMGAFVCAKCRTQHPSEQPCSQQ
jgi:hypothetical protein